MQNNHNNLGDEFRFAVQDALSKGDFSKLNYLVNDTVTDAIAEAGNQFKKAAADAQREFEKNPQPQFGRRDYTTMYRTAKAQPKQNLPAACTRKVGQVSSILYTIFGGIGIGTFALTLLILLIVMASTGLWSSALLGVTSVAIIGFAFMLRTGLVQSRRLSRMKRYVSLCDDNMYINISDLAQHTHRTSEYVLKDIRKMLQLGFFPQGHLDKEQRCLMLDDATYREYLRVEEQRSQIAQQEAEKKNSSSAECDAENDELTAVITEGQSYIEKLHHLNDLIEDECVSEKLYRMEDLLKEIFRRLEDAPDQLPKVRKLMNYYLPTTIKLLSAYSEFDDVSAPNHDIASAKSEIEKTIDVINEAFTELLNKLFQRSAFDAATDAQVLQTMLAKEGLTKSNITEGI